MNKAPLNYIEIGNGEMTLVFLHFFGGSANSWLELIELLKPNFKCIAIDLRGFGNSPAPEKVLSVNDSAEDVIKLIQGLNLKNYILIGHSMGGKIALAIAAKSFPGLKSLILVAPSPPTPEPTTEDKTKEMVETFGDRAAVKKLIKKITAKQLPDNLLAPTINDHLKINRIAWDGWILNASQEDISYLMPQIKIPIKVISGDKDPNFSTDFLKETFSKYANSITFEEIKGTGHLIPIEVPNELVDSIKAFI